MKRCINCSSFVENDAIYCPNCGGVVFDVPYTVSNNSSQTGEYVNYQVKPITPANFTDQRTNQPNYTPNSQTGNGVGYEPGSQTGFNPNGATSSYSYPPRPDAPYALTSGYVQYQGSSPIKEDKPSFWLTILSFFIPLAGIIIWAVMRDETPEKAKACGIAALANIILNVVMWTLFFFIFLIAGLATYDALGPISDLNDIGAVLISTYIL